MERITVTKGKKAVKVISFGSAPFGMDRGAMIPNGYQCLTFHARRHLLGETRVTGEKAHPLYRFKDIKTDNVCEWNVSPTGALNEINELVGNAKHRHGYNGRLVLGVAFPLLQERIREMSKETGAMEHQKPQTRAVAEDISFAVPFEEVCQPKRQRVLQDADLEAFLSESTATLSQHDITWLDDHFCAMEAEAHFDVATDALVVVDTNYHSLAAAEMAAHFIVEAPEMECVAEEKVADECESCQNEDFGVLDDLDFEQALFADL